MSEDIRRLDESSLAVGVAALTATDSNLASVVERYGPPPLWPRDPGFPTLVSIILEQQVSLASAAAAYDRLVAALGEVAPDPLLTLSDREMLEIGFSRQKARYVRLLAKAVTDGSFDIASLEQLSDDEARARMLALTGVGPWTANTYLLMALRRPDVWPTGDIALHAAYQDLIGGPGRPTTREMESVAEAWKPWRAVAARILWFHYLGGVG